MARHSVATEITRYPNYKQALAYADNFRHGGRKAYRKNRHYAYYHHTGTLTVQVTRLVPNFYSVVSYPVNGYPVATIEEALKAQELRGWLFTYDTRSGQWFYILGSQVKGIENFKRVRLSIRDNLSRQPPARG